MDPHAYKQDFPILSQRVRGTQPLTYLDNGASTHRPQSVIDAQIQVDTECYSNVHRGAHWLSDVATDRYEESRDRVQQFIGASDNREVVFTSGTTASINLVARGWGDKHLGENDEIVISEMEHHSNIVPWQQLAERTGAVVKFIPIDQTGHLDLEAAEDLISSRTKVIAFAHASNVLGTINPVADLMRLANAVGAVTVLDAAQSAPHMKLNVTDLGVDFVAFSAHKMLGPNGLGVLYGRASLLEGMDPVLGGGSMIHSVSVDGYVPAAIPTRFEAGTPAIGQALAFPAALDYLDAVGLDAIHAHEQQLCELAHRQLAEIHGLTILGPEPAQKTGIVSFVVDGVHPQDLAFALDQQGVAIRAGHHCAMPLHAKLGIPASARCSFYLYNTEEDVAALAAAVRKAVSLFS